MYTGFDRASATDEHAPVSEAPAQPEAVGSEAAPGPLAVTVTCFNNEQTIARTLDSVAALGARVICVDSGSTDATAELCRDRGAVVIHQPFLGYVKQKQFALDEAAKLNLAWTLHLDSDESLEADLRSSVRDAIAADEPAIHGYEINRKVFYCGRLLQHAWQPEWRLRLVRTGKARWTGYDPHDKLELTAAGGRVEKLRGDCRHDSIPSMAEFLARQVSHARIAAESYRSMGRRGKPSKIITSPVGAFAKQMIRCGAYRDGWRGWCAAGATGAAALMKHIVLLEKTRAAESSEQRP